MRSLTRQPPRLPRRTAAALACLLAAAAAPAAHAGGAPRATLAAIDTLAAQPSREHQAALVRWAQGAPLDALLYLLRRGPAELGGAEAPLAELALRRTPATRADLRRRLEARLALADPKRAPQAGREPAELEALRVRASVFRVAAILPDRGDYAAYALSVRAALEAGLGWDRAPGALPVSLEAFGTGDAEAAAAIGAMDEATRSCASVVGELLSGPTFALAAAARFLGVPLVSPTATDESVGLSGPTIFQVGPAARERGVRLARAMFAAGPRKLAVLVSSASARDPFEAAFTAGAESLGTVLVRRDTYAPGNTDFRGASRAIRSVGADVLFWDGDSREADALIRQLAADGVSVRLCGGEALAPEQFHTPTQPLLEGVTYVAEDWRLPDAAQARLDSLARSRGGKPGALWTRGFLAGRRIAAAIDDGARTPGELAARLRHRDPAARAAGFLDCAFDGATLPVFTVTRGKAVELALP